VNSATTKAEKGPSDRQSRLAGVLVKLAAKKMKTSALRIMTPQRP